MVGNLDYGTRKGYGSAGVCTLHNISLHAINKIKEKFVFLQRVRLHRETFRNKMRNGNS